MIKHLYKYVEYSFISDKPYIRYLSVNDILDIESEILKIRGLDPKENKLIVGPDMSNENKWNFYWEAYSPFGMTNLRPGYIEKIDSDLDDVSNIFKNIDKIVLDMDLIAKNTIYQKTRGYYK